VPATGTGSPATLTIGALGAIAVIGLAALAALLTVFAAHGGCSDIGVDATPSANAKGGIPADYLTLYRQAGRAYEVPWTVLAGIGAVESDHGRSRAPGVHSGVNAFGCCAGPMQFNLRNGPPSTWDRYGVDGDRDGRRNPYDPGDAIPAAARYLRALLDDAGGELGQALLGYNHATAYVADVLARARSYAGRSHGELVESGVATSIQAVCATGALGSAAGKANLRAARRLASPRAYRALPSWALASSSSSVLIDARLYDNVTWITRRYDLRVTAAREAGHRTHGDGTAVDLIPAEGDSQYA